MRCPCVLTYAYLIVYRTETKKPHRGCGALPLSKAEQLLTHFPKMSILRPQSPTIDVCLEISASSLPTFQHSSTTWEKRGQVRLPWNTWRQGKASELPEWPRKIISLQHQTDITFKARRSTVPARQESTAALHAQHNKTSMPAARLQRPSRTIGNLTS